VSCAAVDERIGKINGFYTFPTLQQLTKSSTTIITIFSFQPVVLAVVAAALHITKDSKSTMTTPVTVKPATIEVPATGGSVSLELQNSAPEARFCFKVKSTDNVHYRVKPVFGFVEAGGAGQLEVTRLTGPPSNDDRLEILFLPVDAETPDPKAPFSAGTAPAFVLDVPLTAQ
jgi:hypothetical protein